MTVPRLGSRAAQADGEPSEIWKRFAVAGGVLIAIAFALITFFPRSASTSSSASTAMTASSDVIAQWYDGTQPVRQRVANDVASVRGYLATQDGAALRPACSLLADDITEARALTPGPDTSAQNLFDGGLTGYSDGVTACGNLFDGTQVPVATLQQRVRTGLGNGDQQWATLARQLALPVASADPGGSATTPPATASPATPAVSPLGAPPAATPAAHTNAPVAVTTPAHTAPPAAQTMAPPATTRPQTATTAPETATTAPATTHTGLFASVTG
jgi:hypothetical protein